MTINITAIQAFNDNYIWAIEQTEQPELSKQPVLSEQRTVALVDPGEAAPCIEYIEANSLTLTTILITHHHDDHVGAIKQLIARYGDHIKVYGPANENIPHCRLPLSEGDQVTLDSPAISLEVFDVPGHTAGHIVYFNEDLLFSGDTLFSGGCGRLFEGTPAQMHHSLAKLKRLSPQTKVYCAHEYTLANLAFAQAVEPENKALMEYIGHAKSLRAKAQPTIPTNIATELAINPFLRSNHADVKQSAERFSGKVLVTEVEVFAAVRRWKDEF
ncbi:hydroxyacylglutathione hydrolase [Thalassotalea euphylliae]|uniref:Hydroxyacylglutathione hydrolase n=1 Tax=Thalassotalea euphylliae TaxID=1655234 RepID=A0A3E0TS20_9GAMM|nr:hydroxyacylglutathione hydrolase [Thalassotalea euphylliae]REL27127.1 hydroxyacylglutathione hydrolase [Thalassotalea euphylliae]